MDEDVGDEAKGTPTEFDEETLKGCLIKTKTFKN